MSYGVCVKFTFYPFTFNEQLLLTNGKGHVSYGVQYVSVKSTFYLFTFNKWQLQKLRLMSYQKKSNWHSLWTLNEKREEEEEEEEEEEGEEEEEEEGQKATEGARRDPQWV